VFSVAAAFTVFTELQFHSGYSFLAPVALCKRNTAVSKTVHCFALL
jgi:hypothetical protein